MKKISLLFTSILAFAWLMPVQTALAVDTTISPSLSRVEITAPAGSNQVPADYDHSATITVTAKNPAGEVLAERLVRLTSSDPAVIITPSQGYTNNNGVYSFVVRSNQVGDPKFTAAASGVVLNEKPIVAFVGGVSVINSTLDVNKITATANGTDSVVATVVAKDAAGHALSGKTVGLIIDAPSVTVTPSSVVTDANGQAVFSIKATQAQVIYVTAAIDGVNIGQQRTITFEAPANTTVSASLSGFTVTPTGSIIADNIQTATITVFVRNSSGVALTGKTVTLSSSFSGMTITPSQGTSNQDGSVAFTVKSYTAGTPTFTTVADGVTLNQQPSVTFATEYNNTISASMSAVYLSSPSNTSQILADGNQTGVVTVVVRNSSGVALGNKNVSMMSSFSGLTIAGTQMVTDQNGIATFVIKSNTVGTPTFTTVADGVTLNQQPTVSFVSQPVLNPTNQTVSAVYSNVAASPAAVTVSTGEVTVSSYVRNSLGQALGGKLVQLVATGPQTVGPLYALSDNNGLAVHRLKFPAIGFFTLTISSEGTSFSQKPIINVSAPALGACIFAPGKLIKLYDDSNPNTQEDTAVYYYGKDCKRHSFPNSQTYFTWYADFGSVESISLQTMSQISLGSNVTYRPGMRLVKFQTLNKVYAVSKGGALKWITSEDLARVLYGQGWNQLVQDIPDTFYGNYVFGPPIYYNYEYSRLSEMDMVPTIDDNM